MENADDVSKARPVRRLKKPDGWRERQESNDSRKSLGGHDGGRVRERVIACC